MISSKKSSLAELEEFKDLDNYTDVISAFDEAHEKGLKREKDDLKTNFSYIILLSDGYQNLINCSEPKDKI